MTSSTSNPAIAEQQTEKLHSNLSPSSSNVHGESEPMDLKEGEVFFKGTVERVTFHNPDTGFSVLRVNEDHTILSTTLVGVSASALAEGAYVIARGAWHTHPKFGRQFKARTISESRPTSVEAITRYLSSGIVKGVGPKTAEKITKYFGEQTLEILDKEPSRLSEVPGLSQNKAFEIESIWKSKEQEREVFLFFQTHGISFSIARKIYQNYGARSIETVSENPYILCKSVWGIGFVTADRIAISLGMALDAKERIIAGLSHALSEAQSDGNTFLPKSHLIKKAASLLGISAGELIENALEASLFEGAIIEHKEHYYLPLLFTQERKAAECIVHRITQSNTTKEVPQWILEETIETRKSLPGTDTPIVLSDEQKQAVRICAENSMAVITGGPGCGKTTVVRTITSLFKKAGFNIKLAAPTGRAAQRLQEVCSAPASTIHRLLKFDPMKKAFMHDETDPLEVEVLIIDECSMIDIPLAADLLKALAINTRIIFVGDKDQLPSVGPGLFFSDLLQIPEIPQVKLTRLFRREAESSINNIAHQVNFGSVPDIPEPDGSGPKDAYFLPVETPEEAGNLVERLVCEQVPKQFEVSPEDIMVLTPMNQGDLGIVNLNSRLQSRLVPVNDTAPRVKVGNLEFRLGDRICQRVNNYQLHENGVYNGEQGKVIGIDTTEKKLIVQLWDGREITYEQDTLSQLDLAYALTIHRSQGSEVPVIILIVHDSHTIMLERQLVYTGITRAKRLLLVVGTKSALKKSVQRIRSSDRFTGFRDMILNHI